MLDIARCYLAPPQSCPGHSNRNFRLYTPIRAVNWRSFTSHYICEVTAIPPWTVASVGRSVMPAWPSPRFRCGPQMGRHD